MHIDGLVQETRNSIALAMELRLFCTNLLIYATLYVLHFGHQLFSLGMVDIASKASKS